VPLRDNIPDNRNLTLAASFGKLPYCRQAINSRHRVHKARHGKAQPLGKGCNNTLYRKRKIGGRAMQTTQATILAEISRWEQAQKDLEAVMNGDVTVRDHGRLKRVHDMITQEITKYKAALNDYPNVN
jgi:hypothetical protein